MPEARVRIVLDDEPDGGNTWITVVPVRRSYPNRSTGVAIAVGEAAALFITTVMRDAELVAERLVTLEQEDSDQ